jgi:hypothetical protein
MGPVHSEIEFLSRGGQSNRLKFINFYEFVVITFSSRLGVCNNRNVGIKTKHPD